MIKREWRHEKLKSVIEIFIKKRLLDLLIKSANSKIKTLDLQKVSRRKKKFTKKEPSRS